MKDQWFLGVGIAILAVSSLQAQTKKLAATQAKDHIGERATVCGRVASTRYAERSKGEPTFINLDKPYPKQIFTIVIWGNDRQKFGNPESKYTDKSICVTAKITGYKGEPEAVATDPGQIEIE